MADAVPCPEREDLQRFLMGRLAEADALPVQDHVAKCSSCLDTLHSLEADDTLMAAMRAHQKGVERSEDAIVEGIVAHMSGLHPAATATAAPNEAQGCGFLAPAQAADELGWLGGYRITKILGAGGMGIVFEAEDTRLKRRVALKVMKPALAANKAARQRFQREAEAIAALEHDHIVAIYQVGEDRGVPFLAMPLLKGESLQDRLDREGTLPTGEVLRIGREIASGLAAAHERGLVHRDVKPANVWLEGSTGRIKLLDFGLARPLVENSHLTQEGVVAGTPHYMAPEQAMGKPVDHRCDLFSLGCVLYRMSTGTLPFPGANMLEVLQVLATTTPSPVTSHNAKIPTALNDLIATLLARVPEQRPTSASAVQEAIAAMERPPAPAQRSWRPLATAAAVILAVGLAIATVYCGPAVYRFATNQGQLIVETNDSDVEITIKKNGELIRIVDAKTGQVASLNLKAGVYQVELVKGKAGMKLSTPEFTLERNGEQIVKVWLERAPLVKPNVPMPVPVKDAMPFAVMTRASTAERAFPTLAAAVSEAKSGDTIEIRGNGPFVTPALNLGKRAMVLRAGEGFEPILQIDAKSLDANLPLITTDGPLTLEGLHFRLVEEETRKAPAYTFVHARHEPLSVTHCRFFAKVNRHFTALFPDKSSRVQVRHCEFGGYFPGAIGPWDLGSVHEVEVSDCLCWGSSFFIGYNHLPTTTAIALRLYRNTFVGHVAIHHYYAAWPKPAADGQQPPFRIDARENIFDTGLVFGPTLVEGGKFQPDVDQALVPRCFAWTENKNLYGGTPLSCLLAMGQNPDKRVEVIKTLPEWQAFWGLKDTGCLHQLPRYHGGMGRTLKTAKDRTTAADFRLHKDSAGKSKGEGGRDLGADVDQVGPGKAYELWKKTPAYETWLSSTRQVAPFVLMAGADKAELKFSNLGDAVANAKSGDVIEIRGNGPFVTPKVTIQDRRVLVIRAGAGFEPTLQPDGQALEKNTYLLGSNGPLVLEGLVFRHEDVPGRTDGYYNFVRCAEASLSITHCRFFLKSNRNNAALNTDNPGRVQVRHCEFAGAFNLVISFRSAAAFDQLELTDNLCWGAKVIAINHHQAPATPRGVEIRMHRNTFVGYAAISHFYNQLAESPFGAGLKPFNFELRENVLDAEIALNLCNKVERKFQPEADQILLPRAMAWNESKNLYTGTLLCLEHYGGTPPRVDFFKNVKDWRAYWGLKETGSQHGRLRYQGGDVRARKTDEPDKLTAADFRLHKNSEGKGDGESGRDLGADVDKIGPGKAYHEWKKTPAYQAWLIATRQAPDPEPFVIIGPKREFTYANLKEAIARARDGDVIEIRGDGPFITDPLKITDKALTIRADRGFTPVIQLSAAAIPKGEVMLETDSPLTLEGLEFQRIGIDKASVGAPRKLIHSRQAPLHLAHCRFLVKGCRAYIVWASGAPRFEVRHCFFAVDFAPETAVHSLHWSERPPRGRMTVENCLNATGNNALHVIQSGFDAGDASVRVANNTILAGTLFTFHFKESNAPRHPAARPTRIEASCNVFDAYILMGFAQQWKERRPLDFKEGQAALAELIDWRDQRNQYRVPQDYYLQLSADPAPRQTVTGVKGLAEWLAFWKAKDTTSIEKAPRYQSDVLNKRDLKRPEELRPEDFRLQPGSPGHGAGENGRDLGADVIMVGPGPAYDYWRRTPEYQDWLKSTGRRP